MSTQPIIEKLIEAHLDFLDEQFAQTQVIQQEFEQFIIGWGVGNYNNCGLLNRFNILFKSKF